MKRVLLSIGIVFGILFLIGSVSFGTAYILEHDTIIGIVFGILFLIGSVSFGTAYILEHDTITVLEIRIVELDSELFHRVSYVRKSFFGKSSSHVDFKTFLGVENYLNEVTDRDLSQWRDVK